MRRFHFMLERFPVVLLLLIFATGCRFYGTAETIEAGNIEIQALVGWAETESQRIEADQAALLEAGYASTASAVSDLAGRWIGVTEFWKQQAAALGDSGSHREVRRALAGMISERQRHEDAYVRILASLGGAAIQKAARSQFEPTFYQRVHYRADRRGVRDILPVR